MKTLFLFPLLIAAFVVNAQFAPIGAKWHYSASGNGTAPSAAEYYKYESVKDTLMEGRNAKKIVISYFKYNGTTAYPEPLFTSDAGDTVYYYNKRYAKFLPLYIFNVKKGDTITYHVPRPVQGSSKTTFRVVVDSVYYLEIGPLKAIKTHPLDEFSFHKEYIQKVGGVSLMLHQSVGLIPEGDGPLRCYRDDETYVNFAHIACDYRLTSGIEETDYSSTVSLFPNPTTTQLNVQTNAAYPVEYRISNTLGQTVLSGKLQKEESISTEELKEGLYHVELSNGSWKKRKSFLVKN